MRDEFGQWDPRNQRPELWSLYNGRHLPGEHVRVFPLSNWTELDVWDYIESEKISLPSIYYAHERQVVQRDGMWIAITDVTPALDGERVELRSVRYRTVGDMSCTAAVLSKASTVHDVITEVGLSALTERGATRADDRLTEAAMEDRKREGYFLMATATYTNRRTIQHGRTLLRLATAGSVDDGKSTLVGRLLFDTNSVLTDTLDHVEQVSKRKGLDRTDLALLTDGLRAEREQGITIDVAYRYFATPARKFILADCPGHAVHPQHGHGILDSRCDRAARRRPQRRR